jgi:hypothetical protein
MATDCDYCRGVKEFQDYLVQGYQTSLDDSKLFQLDPDLAAEALSEKLRDTYKVIGESYVGLFQTALFSVQLIESSWDVEGHPPCYEIGVYLDTIHTDVRTILTLWEKKLRDCGLASRT